MCRIEPSDWRDWLFVLVIAAIVLGILAMYYVALKGLIVAVI